LVGHLIGMLLFVFQLRSLLEEIFHPQPLSEREQIDQLIAFKRFGDAYNLLTKIISTKKAPGQPQFLLLRALCATKMDMPNECLADCADVLRIKTADQTQVRTALTYCSTAHLQLGNFTAAEKDAKSTNDKKALASIADARALLKRCKSQFANGQFGESKESLDRLLRVCPKAPEVLLMRSDIAWMEGDFHGFDELSRPILVHFPEDARLHFRRGVVTLCADELNESRRLLRQATAQRGAPRNASLALGVVEILLNVKRKTEALLAENDTKAAEFNLNRTVNASRVFCEPRTLLGQHVAMLVVRYRRMTGGDKREIIRYVNSIVD
jgi:tetratricopeptide (TPR) repeat protein